MDAISAYFSLYFYFLKPIIFFFLCLTVLLNDSQYNFPHGEISQIISLSNCDITILTFMGNATLSLKDEMLSFQKHI